MIFSLLTVIIHHDAVCWVEIRKYYDCTVLMDE